MKKKSILCLLFLVLCLASGCEQKEKNVLRVGVDALTGVYQPVYYTSVYDGYVSDLIFESLLRKNKEGNSVPVLAANLPEVSEDHKKVTYTLKDHVIFSNGAPFTSEDVAFTIHVICDPSYMGAHGVRAMNIVGYEEYRSGRSERLEGMEIIDEHTISFTFQEGYRTNAEDIGKIGILCASQYPEVKYGDVSSVENSKEYIGTGPYVLKSSDETNCVLKKREDYYEEGYAIEHVVLKVVSSAAKWTELKNEDIDLVNECIDPDIIKAAKNTKHIKENRDRRGAMGVLTYNSIGTPTKDVSVRQALSYAFDREGFVDAYFGSDEIGFVPKSYQNPLSSCFDDIMQSKEIEAYAYDIKKANDRLEADGWLLAEDGICKKNGERLTIRVLALADNPFVNTMLPMWEKDWKDIGAEVKVEQMDMTRLSSIVMEEKNKEEWSVFFMGMYFDGSDPDSIYTLFHSSQAMDYAGNVSRIQDDVLDALLEEAKYEKDEEAIKSKYLAAAKRINALCVELPVYGNYSYDLYHERIQSFYTTSLYPWTYALKEAYLA